MCFSHRKLSTYFLLALSFGSTMRLTKLFECRWKKCGWLTIPAETGEGCGPAQGHLLSHTNVKGSSKSPEPEQTEMSPLSWCSTCNRVFLFLPGLPDLYLYFGNPSLICCFTYPSITESFRVTFLLVLTFSQRCCVTPLSLGVCSLQWHSEGSAGTQRVTQDMLSSHLSFWIKHLCSTGVLTYPRISHPSCPGVHPESPVSVAVLSQPRSPPACLCSAHVLLLQGSPRSAL